MKYPTTWFLFPFNYNLNSLSLKLRASLFLNYSNKNTHSSTSSQSLIPPFLFGFHHSTSSPSVNSFHTLLQYNSIIAIHVHL